MHCWHEYVCVCVAYVCRSICVQLRPPIVTHLLTADAVSTMTAVTKRADTGRDLDPFGDAAGVPMMQWPDQSMSLASALREQLACNFTLPLLLAEAKGMYISSRRVPVRAYIDVVYFDVQQARLARFTARIEHVLCVTRRNQRDALLNQRDALLKLRLLAPTSRRNVLVDAQRCKWISFARSCVHRYEVSWCVRCSIFTACNAFA